MIEHALISTLAENPELLPSITVSSADFTSSRDSKVFQVVSDLIKQGKEPDIVLVGQSLEFQDGDNWMPYLAEIYQQHGTPKNVHEYAEIIKRNRRRVLLTNAGKDFLAAVDEPGTLSAFMDKI